MLENLSDRMEAEVGKYLSDVSDAHLSDATKAKIRFMFRQINELESIGDSCQGLSRILRRQTTGEKLTPALVKETDGLFGVISECLDNMDEVLRNPESETGLEDRKRVKALCASLRAKNIEMSDERAYSFAVSTMFNDIVNEVDDLSGFIQNVEQARRGGKVS